MKKLVMLSLLSLFAQASYSNSSLVLSSKFLEHIDGTRLVNMGEIMRCIHQIERLRGTKVSQHTWTSLVQQESHIEPKQRDLILKKFISQFVIMTKKYFEDLIIIRDPLLEIIKHWIVLRELPSSKIVSLVEKTNTKHLDTVLVEHVTTLSDFDHLMTDLHLFLQDLSHNLPKSLQLYRQAEMKSKENEHHRAEH